MISIPWAWDVNKYQILVPLIPLKVPKSILEVFKTLPEICSQHLILQSGPTVPCEYVEKDYLTIQKRSHCLLLFVASLSTKSADRKLCHCFEIITILHYTSPFVGCSRVETTATISQVSSVEFIRLQEDVSPLFLCVRKMCREKKMSVNFQGRILGFLCEVDFCS